MDSMHTLAAMGDITGDVSMTKATSFHREL